MEMADGDVLVDAEHTLQDGTRIRLFALVTVLVPRQMSRWQMQGLRNTTTIEPSWMRILMMRLMGVVIGGIALLMVFGSPRLLLR